MDRNKIRIPILDFGMGGELSVEQRRALLLVAAGTEIYDAEMVAESLLMMSDRESNKIDDTSFLQEVHFKINSMKRQNITMSADHWITWSLNQGLAFSADVIGVSRGFVILDRLLGQSGSSLDMLSLGKKIVKKNIFKTVSNLRATGKVTFTDLMRLLLSTFKKKKKADNYLPICREIFL